MTSLASDTGCKPKGILCWCRFSVRMLLVFVTLACVGFAWLATKFRAKQEERQSVRAFQTHGDPVVYDYQIDAGMRLLTSTTPPGPVWLRTLLGDDCLADVAGVVIQPRYDSDYPYPSLTHLKAFPRLKMLDLSGTAYPDAELANLREATQLEWLDISQTRYSDTALTHLQGLTQLKKLRAAHAEITDGGLVCLPGLTQLKVLSLGANPITDAGLVNLCRMTELKALNLSNMGVTDAGIVHLKGLKHLERLDLTLTRVTDAGIGQLRGLTELRTLDVLETQVSEKGVEELKRALPKLEIRHSLLPRFGYSNSLMLTEIVLFENSRTGSGNPMNCAVDDRCTPHARRHSVCRAKF